MLPRQRNQQSPRRWFCAGLAFQPAHVSYADGEALPVEILQQRDGVLAARPKQVAEPGRGKLVLLIFYKSDGVTGRRKSGPELRN